MKNIIVCIIGITIFFIVSCKNEKNKSDIISVTNISFSSHNISIKHNISNGMYYLIDNKHKAKYPLTNHINSINNYSIRGIGDNTLLSFETKLGGCECHRYTALWMFNFDINGCVENKYMPLQSILYFNSSNLILGDIHYFLGCNDSPHPSIKVPYIIKYNGHIQITKALSESANNEYDSIFYKEIHDKIKNSSNSECIENIIIQSNEYEKYK